LFAAVAVLVSLSAAPGFAASYTFDPAHSKAFFSVRHMMVTNVRGELGVITGTVNVDEKDIAKSSVDATVDVTTLTTREEKRDAHLKSPDFFDVAKYPNLTFKSSKVEKAGPGKLKVAGELTIRGVTKPVTLDVEMGEKDVKDLAGHWKRGASATTKINRKDFGLMWNKPLEGGGVLVGDEVTINLDIELQRTETKTVTGSR
jgi:polyisoprenoid-binding protein YceI